MTQDEIERLPEEVITARALRAVAKINRDGIRGTTLCSTNEIEAMALLLALLADGAQLELPAPDGPYQAIGCDVWFEPALGESVFVCGVPDGMFDGEAMANAIAAALNTDRYQLEVSE